MNLLSPRPHISCVYFLYPGEKGEKETPNSRGYMIWSKDKEEERKCYILSV